MPRTYFFGCWNVPGHYLYAADGRTPPDHDYRWGVRFDGTCAPRLGKVSGRILSSLTYAGVDRVDAISDECPQGRFLRHVVDGFTLISWWDRTQGDRRPNCSSTFLLEGDFTSVEMVTALAVHFPHVVANLERAGDELVEVHP